ncbi:hypothetical protein C8R45DRAFT_1109067 [Mycena sanguinolenta]|nr:hypothetical protein C8R45DRAFT_1109067 [Mycena sanguinolenta]
MPPTTIPKPSTGPPQALIERINYLGQLLTLLPTTLPAGPTNAPYRFFLDEDRVTFAGSILPEVQRALEASFETFNGPHIPVRFQECSAHVQALIPFLKASVKQMNPGEREAFEAAWMDKLVGGAKESGAKIPSRTRKHREREEQDHGGTEAMDDTPAPKKSRTTALITIVDSDSDLDMQSAILSSIPKQTINPNIIIPSTVDVNLKQNQQVTLADMGWQAWGDGAKEAHQKEMAKRHREGVEEWREKCDREKEEKEERKRQLTAERQRRHRAKKRAKKDEEELLDDNNVNVVLCRGADAQAREHAIDVAGVSRPGTQRWRGKRNGTKGGAVQKKAATVNYYHPFLFMHIDKAMACMGCSLTAAVNLLQHDYPVLFKSLRKGTISRWRVKGKKEWSAATMEKVTVSRAIAASGRTGILAPYPEITKQVKETLQGLRVAGAIVNVSIVRRVLITEINQQQPHLLSKFKVSEYFVRMFLSSVMDWTPRKGTRAACHILEDAPELLKRTFFRLCYAILTGGIPPELIVNADQAGNYLLPASGHTFHDRGAKQVDLVAKDEKRTYTMMLASTPAGNFLPIQAVWAGKTGGSLSMKNAEKMQEAVDRGFVFSSAKIEGVLSPWREKIIARDNLDPEQLMVAYLDIYPVHTSADFRSLIFDKFPFIILIFVPNGCTGLFQPADVGLQRVAKHILKQDSLDYLVDIFQTQRKKGVAPKDIKFPSSLPVLRDATVRGLVKMYDFFQTPEGRAIVQQAWRKCEVLHTEWNLSSECLYGKHSAKALQQFLREDTTLATEIANRCGAAHLAKTLETPGDEALDEKEGDFDTNDDSDVSLPAVVGGALGIAVDVESFSERGPVTHLAALWQGQLAGMWIRSARQVSRHLC